MGTIKATKTVKIELAIVDDIQKTITTYTTYIDAVKKELTLMNQANNDIINAKKAADKAASSATSLKASARAAQTSASNSLSDADVAAKALGIAPATIKGYSQAAKLYDTLELSIKELSSFKWV